MKMPFGKWKGMDIEDVPDSYLRWLLGTDWFEKKFIQMVKPIDEELAYREKWDIRVLDDGSRVENWKTGG